MNKLSISMTIRFILLTGLLSLFFACSSASKDSGETKELSATQNYWAIPEPYTNLSVEQIKSQIEITDYMVMKGAATNAATEDMTGDKNLTENNQTGKTIGAATGAFAKDPPKNVKDRAAFAEYTNKLISLEGVINTAGTQKTSPLDIKETLPGKYEVWFCADKNQQRKPCRYRAYLLYEAPEEGKGDTLFTKENVIRFWGVILGEQIGQLTLQGYTTYKRYPKIRVVDLEIIK